MIKLFFFGTLPLGWKRFLRAISFVWAVVHLYNAFDFGFNDRDGRIFLLLSFGVPMILSYAISGFFGKKTD
tara:strand:+ start:137 stop:349 length:213 start_codon:yes stop_codon:yes gene_type:complete